MKPPRAADSQGAMSPLAAAMWTIGLSLLEQACIAATDSLRPGGLTDVVNITACEMLATSLAVVAILRAYAPESTLRDAFGARTVGIADLVVALVAGAGLSPLLSTLDEVILRRWPYDAEALANMATLVARSSRLALVLGIFVVIPAVRETFFRGILFERLRRSLPEAATIGVTAVLFACSSLDWRAMPSALILGVALSYLRGCSGSVFAPIAAHLAFWAVDGIPILEGRDPSADVVYPAKWLAGGAAVALVTLFVYGRHRRVTDRSGRRAPTA